MRTLLIILTVVEILVVVGALAYYLIVISRSLERISDNLGKVTFGVRAIETQCESIGPSVTRINQQLTGIAGALQTMTDKANRVAGR
jgi:uncharacterized protein YoxC